MDLGEKPLPLHVLAELHTLVGRQRALAEAVDDAKRKSEELSNTYQRAKELCSASKKARLYQSLH